MKAAFMSQLPLILLECFCQIAKQLFCFVRFKMFTKELKAFKHISKTYTVSLKVFSSNSLIEETKRLELLSDRCL